MCSAAHVQLWWLAFVASDTRALATVHWFTNTLQLFCTNPMFSASPPDSDWKAMPTHCPA